MFVKSNGIFDQDMGMTLIIYNYKPKLDFVSF